MNREIDHKEILLRAQAWEELAIKAERLFKKYSIEAKQMLDNHQGWEHYKTHLGLCISSYINATMTSDPSLREEAYEHFIAAASITRDPELLKDIKEHPALENNTRLI